MDANLAFGGRAVTLIAGGGAGPMTFTGPVTVEASSLTLSGATAFSSGNVTVNAPVTANGPLTFSGANVDFNGAVTDAGSAAITSGTVTWPPVMYRYFGS